MPRISPTSRWLWPNASPQDEDRALARRQPLQQHQQPERDLLALLETVSSGPSAPSPVNTGSGNHSPTYRSRLTRADVRCVTHRFVTTFVSHASGRVTTPSFAAHRRYASCRMSCASDADPSIRYASPNSRPRYRSNSTVTVRPYDVPGRTSPAS